MKIFALCSVVFLVSLIGIIFYYKQFWRNDNPQQKKMDKVEDNKGIAAILPREGKKKVSEEISLIKSPDSWLLTGLGQPFGINFDRENNFYIADFQSNSIIKINPDFSHVSFLTSEGWSESILSSPFFSKPHSIDFDQKGNIFIADYGNGEIKKFDQNGTYLFSINDSLVGPVTATTGPDEKLYIADYKNSKLFRYHSETKQMELLEDDLDRLHTAKFDQKGNMYIVDTWNHRVVKYDRKLDFIGAIGKKEDGKVTSEFESTNLKFVKSNQEGGFFAPVAIAFDEKGNLYISEAGDGSKMRIQVFSNDGEFIRILGQFNAPYDIKIKYNYLFIAEPYLGQVKILDLNNFDSNP